MPGAVPDQLQARCHVRLRHLYRRDKRCGLRITIYACSAKSRVFGIEVTESGRELAIVDKSLPEIRSALGIGRSACNGARKAFCSAA